MSGKGAAIMAMHDAGRPDLEISRKLSIDVRVVRRVITMETARRANPEQSSDHALGRRRKGLPSGHLKPWPAQTVMFADFKVGQSFGRVERPAPDYTLGGVA